MRSAWPGDAQKEITTFGALTRGQLMARVRSTGNATTEKRLALLLRLNGLSGWRTGQQISGKPDFVWRNAKVAVFVDGCFWHGHQCGKNIAPRTNASAWDQKITSNKKRDKRTAALLRREGWRVVRIWECSLRRNPNGVIRKIGKVLRR